MIGESKLWRYVDKLENADGMKCKWEFHVEGVFWVFGIFFSRVFALDHRTCFCSKCFQGQRSLLWRFEALACCWPTCGPWGEGNAWRGREDGHRGVLLFAVNKNWATKQCFDWKSSSRSIWPPGNAPGNWGVWEWGVIHRYSSCSCLAEEILIVHNTIMHELIGPTLPVSPLPCQWKPGPKETWSVILTGC